MRQGEQFQNDQRKIKESDSKLILIHFCRPPLGQTTKINCVTVASDISNFVIL